MKDAYKLKLNGNAIMTVLFLIYKKSNHNMMNVLD